MGVSTAVRRTIGFALIVTGLIPAIGLLCLWLWARHMYVVGVSFDPRATAALLLLVLADLICLGGGVYLLRRPLSN
jgi:hypothetical protein